MYVWGSPLSSLFIFIFSVSLFIFIFVNSLLSAVPPYAGERYSIQILSLLTEVVLVTNKVKSVVSLLYCSAKPEIFLLFFFNVRCLCPIHEKCPTATCDMNILCQR